MHQLSRRPSATPTRETNRRLDIPPQPAKPKIQRSLTACLPNLLNTYCCHTLGVACTAGHLWLYLRPSPPRRPASIFLCVQLPLLTKSLWSISTSTVCVVPIAKPESSNKGKQSSQHDVLRDMNTVFHDLTGTRLARESILSLRLRPLRNTYPPLSYLHPPV